MTTAEADSTFRELRQQLRERVHVTDVLQKCGIPFRLSGERRGRAFCPFHPDRRRPSLTFGEKRTCDEGPIEVWQCWTCRMNGDVFTLVQLLGNYASRTEAIRALAEEHGLRWPGRNGEAQSGAQRVLDTATAYYADRLADEPLRYLTSRALPEPLLRRFRVGYAPESPATGFTRFAESQKFDLIAESIGLIQPATSQFPRRDWFFGRIMFPNLVRRHTIDLQGRAFPDRDPKYLARRNTEPTASPDHPGPVRLYNMDDCGHTHVLLCEGIPDTLSAVAAGVPACGIYGTNAWRDEYRARFRNCTRVYVTLDRDAIDEAIDLARAFGTRGRVLVPPQDLGEHGDLNDWLRGPAAGDPDQFRDLLLQAMETSPTPWELWIDRLPNVLRSEQHAQVRPLLRDLTPLPRTFRDGLLEALARKAGISGVTLYAEVAEFEEELATSWVEEVPEC